MRHKRSVRAIDRVAHVQSDGGRDRPTHTHTHTRAEEHNITRCHAQDFTTLPSRRWSSSASPSPRPPSPPRLHTRPLTAGSSLSKRGSPFVYAPRTTACPRFRFSNLQLVVQSPSKWRGFPRNGTPSKEAGLGSRFREGNLGGDSRVVNRHASMTPMTRNCDKEWRLETRFRFERW